jgi:DHA2 family multidrug resistance protein
MSSQFRPPNLALSTVGLSLATFMQVLDTTIANVALPTIAGNLGVSQNQGTWVVTSFAVSTAIATPLTGFLSRRFGETRLFVWSTLLFSLASFLCGISQSMGMLIVFRAVQGIVAGPMYPVTQSLLISVYPPAKRGMALALLAMVTIAAPIAGPILGGWITDDYSWPWIFFINVPLGIFASVVMANQLKGRPETIEKPRIDYVGLVTLAVGVGALQLFLDKGNDEDWFASPFIVSTAIVATIGLAIFVIWELTDDHPIVDLKLFRHRNFMFGTLALTLAYSAFFTISFLVPQWMQRNLGYTATWAGLASAPIGIFPILLAPVIGRYATRFDLRGVTSVAFLIIGSACFLRSSFYSEIDFTHVAEVQLFQGLGLAFFYMPVLTILLSDLRPNEIAAGSGLATFLRTMGGSFAASLSTFLWDRRAVMHHARLAEGITPFDPGTSALVRSSDPQSALASLNQTLTREAYQISFNEVFYLLGGIFLALIIAIWLTRPPFNAKVDAGAGGH